MNTEASYLPLVIQNCCLHKIRGAAYAAKKASNMDMFFACFAGQTLSPVNVYNLFNYGDRKLCSFSSALPLTCEKYPSLGFLLKIDR